jgi:hypothetical protein
VGGKGVDYIVYWRVVEEQRYDDDVALVERYQITTWIPL